MGITSYEKPKENILADMALPVKPEVNNNFVFLMEDPVYYNIFRFYVTF